MRIKKTISIPVYLTILVFLSIIAVRIVQFLEWKKDADRFVKAAKIMELLDEASDAAKMCGQFEKFLSSRREFKPSPSVPGDGNPEIWEGYKNGVFHGVPRSDDAELAELKAFFEAQFFRWIRREAGDE